MKLYFLIMLSLFLFSGCTSVSIPVPPPWLLLVSNEDLSQKDQSESRSSITPFSANRLVTALEYPEYETPTISEYSILSSVQSNLKFKAYAG